jgi:branched-subunit amino acid aminotransferase/4-amino-4-deoxychorismate lyase
VKILETKNYPILENSSFLRGEQVFTSMLFYNGKFLFFNEHIERLIKGAAFLFPLHNWEGERLNIKSYLEIKTKELSGDFYCRLTIVEDYFFTIVKPHELAPLNISLAKAFQIKTPSIKPSYLKLSQYADSHLELKQTKSDDIIYFDQNSFVTEASTSNIFVVLKSGKIITPYLSSMVLEGILRKKLLQKLNIIEQNITEDDLINSQEIWLSNSIKGLRFVKTYNNHEKIFEKSLFENVIVGLGRYGEKFNE